MEEEVYPAVYAVGLCGPLLVFPGVCKVKGWDFEEDLLCPAEGGYLGPLLLCRVKVDPCVAWVGRPTTWRAADGKRPV